MDIGPNLPIAQNTTPDATLALAQSAQNDGSKAAQKLRSAQNIEQIEAAAKEFEAVFLSEMLKPMFKGTEVEAPFGGGKGEEIFNGMMVQEYGKIMSERGGIGIAEQVKTEMIRLQEAQINN